MEEWEGGYGTRTDAPPPRQIGDARARARTAGFRASMIDDTGVYLNGEVSLRK